MHYDLYHGINFFISINCNAVPNLYFQSFYIIIKLLITYDVLFNSLNVFFMF